jgi:competence protein ComEC
MTTRHPLAAALVAYMLGALVAEELAGVAFLPWLAWGFLTASIATLAMLRRRANAAMSRGWSGLPPELDAAELPPERARERDDLLNALERGSSGRLALAAEYLLLGGMLLLGAARMQPIFDQIALADSWAARMGGEERRWSGRLRAIDESREEGALLLEVADLRAAQASEGEPSGPLPGWTRLSVSPEAVAPVEEARPGDRIEFVARLHRAGSPDALGIVPTSDFVGQFFRARVSRPSNLRIVSRDASGVGTRELLERSREGLRRLFIRSIDDPESSATVRAMCLGDTGGMTRRQRAAYANTGLIHLLSVSGLHAGLLGMALALLGRAAGMSPRSVAIMVAIAVPLYGTLIGFRPPIARACVMTAVFSLAWIVGWDTDPLDSLALAGWAVLAIDPPALFLRSFQLSFLAAASLIILAGKADFAFTPRLPATLAFSRDPRRPFWARAWVAQAWDAFRWALGGLVFRGLWASLAVTLALAPILAHQANKIPLLGALGNLIAVPLATLTVSFGFLAGLCLPLSESLASGLASWAGWSAGLQNAFVGLVDRVPGASVVATPPGPFATALFYGVLLAWPLPRLRPAFPWTRPALRAGLLLRATLASLALVVWSIAPSLKASELEIVFFDVGQGDATLVVMPNGATILVDGGNRFPDSGRQVVLPWLAARGIRTLDAVVATHGDADHIGGLISVLESMPVDRVYEGELNRNSRVFAEWAEARERAVVRLPMEAGWMMADGSGARIVALNPPAKPDPAASSNDRSVVLLVDYHGTEILLPGDAEAGAEWAMLASGWIDDLEVLKAGHHGSATSGSEAFLELARPELVAISCGRDNPYGFPNPEALARYEATGARIVRTDRSGTIRLFVGPDGWRLADPDPR